MDEYKVGVIGAGPAGIAAAIQLKRFGIETSLFEKDEVGGLLWNANLVENLPGFPRGISGPDLIGLFCEHLKNNDIEVIFSKIDSMVFREGKYYLYPSESVNGYDFVIVATGTKPIRSPLIDDLINHVNIHHDIRRLQATSGKKIAIVGGGDAAFDQALNLSRSNYVQIINRTNELKCLPLLSDRAFNNPNIKYLGNTNIKQIESKYNRHGTLDGIALYLKSEGITRREEYDELIFAIGRKPCLELVKPGLKEERLLMVGDVQNGLFRQTSIAVGDGVKAAMKINKVISDRS